MTASSAEKADILVMGGGTAGSVFANRLSSDPSVNMLVLQASENQSGDA